MESAVLVVTTVAVCLMVVIIALGVLIFRHVRQPARIELDFSHSLDYIADSISHHVEVNAVLALTKSFADKPELLESLAGYS